MCDIYDIIDSMDMSLSKLWETVKIRCSPLGYKKLDMTKWTTKRNYTSLNDMYIF